MELAASVSQAIGPNSSVFVYGGLPGEPAFGGNTKFGGMGFIRLKVE